jgi:hypothetical protein
MMTLPNPRVVIQLANFTISPLTFSVRCKGRVHLLVPCALLENDIEAGSMHGPWPLFVWLREPRAQATDGVWYPRARDTWAGESTSPIWLDDQLKIREH